MRLFGWFRTDAHLAARARTRRGDLHVHFGRGSTLVFFKADHKAAYKNLPLNPEKADACIANLRNLPDGLWCGLRPRTLLVGEVSALLRCDFFSRIIAALVNLILGVPTVNYFDDVGSVSKSSISEEALEAFSDFCRTSVSRLWAEQTGLRRQLPFVGLEGHLPAPDNGAILAVNSADAEKYLWADRMDEFLRICHIPHKEPEARTVRLSFSQTSAFARFGGCAVHLFTGNKIRHSTNPRSRARVRRFPDGGQLFSGRLSRAGRFREPLSRIKSFIRMRPRRRRSWRAFCLANANSATRALYRALTTRKHRAGGLLCVQKRT